MSNVPQPGGYVVAGGEEYFIVSTPADGDGHYQVRSRVEGSGALDAIPVREVDEAFSLEVNAVFRGVPVGVPFLSGESAYVVVPYNRTIPFSPDVEWEVDDDPRIPESSAWVSADELTDVTTKRSPLPLPERRDDE